VHRHPGERLGHEPHGVLAETGGDVHPGGAFAVVDGQDGGLPGAGSARPGSSWPRRRAVCAARATRSGRARSPVPAARRRPGRPGSLPGRCPACAAGSAASRARGHRPGPPRVRPSRSASGSVPRRGCVRAWQLAVSARSSGSPAQALSVKPQLKYVGQKRRIAPRMTRGHETPIRTRRHRGGSITPQPAGKPMLATCSRRHRQPGATMDADAVFPVSILMVRE
jgi:hypothetical protein